MKFKIQWVDCPQKGQDDFPDSVVQSNMSMSISQMVRTRSVGGDISAYEMDGIENDAPFDSEYVDFFDMADEAERLASSAKPAVRKPAEAPSQNDSLDPGSQE